MKVLALTGAAAVLLLSPAGASQSSSPQALLSFALYSGAGICLARINGTRGIRFTRGVDNAPSWSPRGSYVAFERAGGEGYNVLVANARGRVLRKLSDDHETLVFERVDKPPD
jgi:Tol biopolymer transport system component